MSRRSMRPLRVTACIAVTFLAARAAAAQAPAPSAAPDSAAESPDAADAAPTFFLVDDALLTGIPLTAAQAQQVMSLRALRAEEVAAIQPEVIGAVRAIARAHVLAGPVPVEPTTRPEAPSWGQPSDRKASVTTASAGTPRRTAVRLVRAPAVL